MQGIEHLPFLVSWNLTRECNLACSHCYIDAQPAAGQELNTAEIRFIMDELSSLNRHLILVLSGGEPMLREDIFEIVEYSSRSGFITVMGSNGTLFTGEGLRLLKKAGLRGLGISIDASDAASHDATRGYDGAWSKAVHALRLAKEAGIETQLDCALTNSNTDQLDQVVSLGLEMGVKAVNFFFIVCTGRAVRSDISRANYDRSLERIATLAMRERRVMVRARCAPHINRVLHEMGSPLPGGARGCLAGLHYLRIDPQGGVSPCPYMPVCVGNARERSLAEIWEKAPLLHLLRSGRYEGRCGACEYRIICGGCRARAGSEAGDCMGEDPLCGYVPKERTAINFGPDPSPELTWEKQARERIEKIPPFMRAMIMRMIEANARKKGVSLVTSALLDELKARHYQH